MRPIAFFLIATVVLGGLSPGAGAAPPAASSPKGPEVTTIGSAPSVRTAADHAKLGEVLRRHELRRASTSPGRARELPAALIAPKSPFLETREAALAPRNRFKAGQPTFTTAPVLPAPLPAPTVDKAKSGAKGGRP